MKKFGIFKMILNGDGVFSSITFQPLPSLFGGKEPLIIHADDEADALKKASDVLTVFGANTHTTLGNPEVIMNEFPNFFIAQFRIEDSDQYDDASIKFRLNHFTPVPLKTK